MRRLACILALALLGLSSFGCASGPASLGASLDRMKGDITYGEALAAWGRPYREHSEGGFLVAIWGLAPRVTNGLAWPRDPYCMWCKVVWQEYAFYFRTSDLVLDHWESPLFGSASQVWQEVELPRGCTDEDCLGSNYCATWLKETCRERVKDPPFIMPAKSPRPDLAEPSLLQILLGGLGE